MSELTLQNVLKLTLSMEEQSIAIYTSALNKALNPSSKVLFKELVEEEERHKNKLLEAMRDPKKVKEIGSVETRIHDLKTANFLRAVSSAPDADYQQILIYAGKREKEIHDFYMELAKKYRDKQIGKMFAKLAQEELKHEYTPEEEYDDVVLE